MLSTLDALRAGGSHQCVEAEVHIGEGRPVEHDGRDLVAARVELLEPLEPAQVQRREAVLAHLREQLRPRYSLGSSLTSTSLGHHPNTLD